MNKKEFDKLGSHIYMPHLIDNSPACPLCGEKTTHPTPNCGCRGWGGEERKPHIMKYHHTCSPKKIKIT